MVDKGFDELEPKHQMMIFIVMLGYFSFLMYILLNFKESL